MISKKLDIMFPVLLVLCIVSCPAQVQGSAGDGGAQCAGAGEPVTLHLRAAAARNDSGHWRVTAVASSDAAARLRPRLTLDALLHVPDGHDGPGAACATLSLEAHVAAAPRGYERMPFGSTLTSLYRLHTSALPWREASAACQAEGAHLIVVNSEVESLVMREFFSRRPTLVGAFNSYWFAVGMRRFPTRNETVLGGPLEDSGYHKWAPLDGQWYLHNTADCGIMDRRLLFALEDCGRARAFVCELEA